MALSSTTTRSSYNGNGSTTAFSTGFKFLANSHVTVVLRDANGAETTWVEGTQYTLTGAGNANGGTVTVDTSPTDYTPQTGEKLIIYRTAPLTQASSLPLGGAFPSITVEEMIDKLTMIAQQQDEQIGRSLLLPVSSSTSDLSLPEPSADKVLGWNSAGTALENKTANASAYLSVSAYAATLLDDTTAAAARTTLGLAALAASGSGADLTANSVPNAKLGTMAQATIKGRASGAGTGDPVDLTLAQVKAILSGMPIQVVNTQTGAVATGTTTIPVDDTIPQNTEGDQYMSLAITPTNASSTLLIEVVCFLATSATGDTMIAALFQDTTASALAVAAQANYAAGAIMNFKFQHKMTAGTTSATTFKVRAGYGTAGTTTFNGAGGARYYGGVIASSITITELVA